MTQSMTQGSPQRAFIELSDILSLRLECKRCHSSITIPRMDRGHSDEKFQTAVRNECPSCGKNWAQGSWHAMAALNAIRSLAESLPTTAGVKFSLEIAESALPMQEKRSRVTNPLSPETSKAPPFMPTNARRVKEQKC
jgi:hypothetical protein